MLPLLKKIEKSRGTDAMNHLKCIICHSKQGSNRELQRHYITYHQLKNCMNCNIEFSKLGLKHFRRCKPQTNQTPILDENGKFPHFPFVGNAIWCLMCFYKGETFDEICKHYLDKHHLKCTRVEEPDFDQVLKRSPYTLERLENYSYNNDNKYGTQTVT